MKYSKIVDDSYQMIDYGEREKKEITNAPSLFLTFATTFW